MSPSNDGVSAPLSPRTIITGIEVDYAHHCRIEFSTYVQTDEEHDNSMRPRTIEAITLHPSGNVMVATTFSASQLVAASCDRG